MQELCARWHRRNVAAYTRTAALLNSNGPHRLAGDQLELDTRARVQSISRGLSADEGRHLVAIASGNCESVDKIVLEKFMGLNLIEHGPDGLGITLDGIRVVAMWYRARDTN